MKKIMIITAASATLMLGACGKDPAPAPKPVETPKAQVAKPEPKKPANAIKTEAEIKQEQQQVHQSVETAMAAIPPEMRENFQKVWDCQAKANGKAGATQVDMNGDWIVRKTAELKQNPGIANCS